jgi:hypothetical protein
LTVVTLNCRLFEAAGVDAIRELPRADFVPGEHIPRAYVDEALRIGHGQATTEPSLVARMVEALALPGNERMLEVHTGYGWQTALLARVAASVWSFERWADLAAKARSRLARASAPSAEMVVGDSGEGLPEHAPFDAIVAAAASSRKGRYRFEQEAAARSSAPSLSRRTPNRSGSQDRGFATNGAACRHLIVKPPQCRFGRRGPVGCRTRHHRDPTCASWPGIARAIACASIRQRGHTCSDVSSCCPFSSDAAVRRADELPPEATRLQAATASRSGNPRGLPACGV